MDSWNALKTECASCRSCPLCEGRHNLVFGVGNEQADLMFVGEGPGEQEDLQGVPFVGPAGRLLDSMLEMIDLDRSIIYIAKQQIGFTIYFYCLANFASTILAIAIYITPKFVS